MSDAPELKPCPFCGGEAEFHSLLPRYDDAFVRCPNCEIDGPRFGGNDDREGSNAQAIAAWNTRAALREIKELEAKLAESEARSEVLETLVMDVAADLYDGVAAHKIDQRIMDAIRQLNEEEEDQ
jgi:Lar family restriction alleviation protein